MILLANGDSFTEGHGIHEEIDNNFAKYISENRKCSWPNHLSKLMNIDYVNLGLRGNSNSKIIRTTMHYILNNKNDYYVVIGFTNFKRFEIKNIIPNFYYDNTDIELFKYVWCTTYDRIKQCQYNNIDEIALKYFEYKYNKFVEYDKFMIELNMFKSFLNLNNIPYLFFNSLDNKIDSIVKYNLYNYCSEKFKKTSNDHFYEDAYIEWANYLYKYTYAFL